MLNLYNMIGIEGIISSIKNFFETNLRNPAPFISGIILICGLARRPGLSCILSTGNILQEISKRGIPTDDLPDGSPNLMNQMPKHLTQALMPYKIFLSLKPGSLPDPGFTI